MEADEGENDDGPLETPLRRRQRPVHIEPKSVFGLTVGVCGNCLYLNDSVIVYPAAGLIVVHDLESGTQRFIPLTGPRKIVTAMDLNTINYMLAVATLPDESEMDMECPIISIYDLRTLSLKHVFNEPEDNDNDDILEEDNEKSYHSRPSCGGRRFAKIQFLYDNIFMAALVVGGDDGSDCTLYYYSWRNSKVDTKLQIDGPVADVALNPIDTNICCFVGKELFRFMTRTEINWSQYGFREAMGIDFTCVCWLDGDRCLAGTSDGRLVSLKNGTLQNSFRVDTIHNMDLMVKIESDRLSVFTPSSDDGRQAEAVRICFAIQYGLVVVVGDTDVYYFRKVEEGRRYVRDRVYRKYEYWYLAAAKRANEAPLHRLESLCVSPNHERLVCLTRCGRLYWAPLGIVKGKDDDDDGESFNSPVEINQLLSNYFHYGGVESLSTSLWKPLLMTCGKIDCAVKLWDYTKCELLLTKQYSQQVHCVSIHPTGLYCVVVFLDHVIFCMIQTVELEQMKLFPIFGYSAVTFSGSGHVFALSKQDQIDVYSSLTFDKRFSCRGHLGIIKSMAWCNQDMNIVAYDTVGAICMFDTRTGKGMMHIAPYWGAAYTGLAVGEDVNRMFVITKDGVLKEVHDRKVIREVNFHHGSLNAVSIYESDSSLFIAAQNGVVIVVLLPMTVTVVQNEFKIHNKSITKMCLTTDGSALITCSEDGSVCIWEVKDNEKDVNEDIRSDRFDDVLVNLSELEKLNEKIIKTELAVSHRESEYSNSINEWTTSNEMEVELKKMSISNHIDFTEKHNRELAVVHLAVINKLQIELAALKAKNHQAETNLVAKYSERLQKKYVKYQLFENKVIAMKEEIEKGLDAQQEKLNFQLQEKASNYEGNLKEKDEEIRKSKDKLMNTNKRLKQLVVDTETDVDQYVSTVRRKLTDKLKNIKQLYLNSLCDHIKYKKEYGTYEKAIKELRQTTDSLEYDISVLEKSAVEKNNRIADLAKILKQHKDEIQQKDVEVLEVIEKKRQSVTLQLTLKASIEELEEDIQSLMMTIESKKNLLEQVETKLNNTEKNKTRFEMYVAELNKTMINVERELSEKNTILQDTSSTIKQLKVDLSEASKSRPSVDESHGRIIEFFNKYLGESVINKIDEEEYEARLEYLRQRKSTEYRIRHMKRTIESFTNPKESHYLLLEENTRLLEEIQALRKEAKMYLTKYNNFKYFLPSNDSKKNHPNKRTERLKAPMNKN